MRRSARLIVRVVCVASAGAADARRRVAEVLLRAAIVGDGRPDTALPTPPANDPPTPAHEKAA